MTKISPFLLAGAIVVLVASLAGCTSLGNVVGIPNPNDLVGRWTEDGPKGERATLTLHSDGSLSGHDVPRQVFELPSGQRVADVDWSQLENSAGTWSVPRTREAGDPAVDIDIEATAHLPAALTDVYLLKSGDDEYVHAVVGNADSDQRFKFHREGGSRTTLER